MFIILTPRETQLTLRFDFTPVRMTKIKKTYFNRLWEVSVDLNRFKPKLNLMVLWVIVMLLLTGVVKYNMILILYM